MPPFFSICIPAYERVVYLRRLLDSIVIQTFRDMEVIINDDSLSDLVFDLVQEYQGVLPIRYFRNSPSLGTPANWNNAIGKATGKWIKLIHDDDWFTSADSLQVFANYAATSKKFIFSAYANHFEDGITPVEEKFLPGSWRKKILQEPMALLAYNVIGPPSVILVERSIAELYDVQFKWRVDMEYYVRLLESLKAYAYIDQVLVNVGVSESQVTQSCIYEPSVELPEGKLLLEKHGERRLLNIWVYDAWWRLLRNMAIFSVDKLQQFTTGEWPAVIRQMVVDLSKTPQKLLLTGAFSKSFMFVSYLKNKSLISRKN